VTAIATPTPIVLQPGVPQILSITMGGQTFTVALTISVNSSGGLSLTADTGVQIQTDSGSQITQDAVNSQTTAGS
jgi:hypothetical protein